MRPFRSAVSVKDERYRAPALVGPGHSFGGRGWGLWVREAASGREPFCGVGTRHERCLMLLMRSRPFPWSSLHGARAVRQAPLEGAAAETLKTWSPPSSRRRAGWWTARALPRSTSSRRTRCHHRDAHAHRAHATAQSPRWSPPFGGSVGRCDLLCGPVPRLLRLILGAGRQPAAGHAQPLPLQPDVKLHRDLRPVDHCSHRDDLRWVDPRSRRPCVLTLTASTRPLECHGHVGRT